MLRTLSHKRRYSISYGENRLGIRRLLARRKAQAAFRIRIRELRGF
jgi:hypothetical protein